MKHFYTKKLLALGCLCVSTLSSWAYELVIPEGTKEISYEEYAGDTTITSVVFPKGLESIETSSFEGCTNLTKVVFQSSSMSYIRSGAFKNCTNLKTWDFSNCHNFYLEGVRISDDAFEQCPKNKTVILSSNSFEVRDGGYSGYNSLSTLLNGVSKIVFDETLSTWIGKGSAPSGFYGGIDTVLVDNVNIEEQTSLVVPDDVTNIGRNAGLYSNLTSLVISDSVRSISKDAFYRSDLRKIVMPLLYLDHYDEYEEYKPTFRSLSNLDTIIYTSCTFLDWLQSSRPSCEGVAKSIIIEGKDIKTIEEFVIPDTICIGSRVFYGFDNLKSVTISGDDVCLGDGSFDYCENLRSLIFAEGTTSISKDIFIYNYNKAGDHNDHYRFDNLTSITVPTSVNDLSTIGGDGYSKFDIRSYALADTLIYGGTLEQWLQHEFVYLVCMGGDSYTFADLVDVDNRYDDTHSYGTILVEGEDIRKKTSLTVPKSVNRISYYALRGCNISEIIFDGTWADWINEDRFEESYNSDKIYLPEVVYGADFLGDAKEGKLMIEGVNLRDVTSMNIPEGVEKVGIGAFYNCKELTSVTIPESVTAIGDGAFRNCTKLSNVKFSDGVKTIGRRAFENCRSLDGLTLPNTLEEIGEIAFEDCSSLSSIVIPQNVNMIGDAAFSGCNNLKKVTCLATVPPSLGEDDYWGSPFANYNAYLYVPKESLEDYDLHSVWGEFKYIVGIDDDKVIDIKSLEENIVIKDGRILIEDESDELVSIFDLQGKCLYSKKGYTDFAVPSQGSYVVRYGNISTKVLVK